jgi:hypothetical protein
MSEQHMNGAAETLPQATELILSNGLKCWVYPVSARDRMRLIQAFNDKDPQPDRKAFERPVPVEDASFEGQTLTADSNPEYAKAMGEWRERLSEYITNAFLVGYTEFPDVDEKELIARFARIIKRKRRVMDLPADEWEATLRFALLDTPDDQRMIISAVEKRLPVEWEGIVDQVAIFRPVNQPSPATGLFNRQSQTQVSEQEAQPLNN